MIFELLDEILCLGMALRGRLARPPQCLGVVLGIRFLTQGVVERKAFKSTRRGYTHTA